MPVPLITLMTDFGSDDAYVAQMKGQILSVCPEARLIDITHSIPAQDVFRGALVLSQSAPHFPAQTIHVVVVDPGVGTERRMLVVEIDTQLDGAGASTRQRFVLPDNGLVSLLVARFGVVSANAITQSRYWRPRVSSTFHGRDIMGPVAAHWAAGVAAEQFGPPVNDIHMLKWPQPELLPSEVRAQVIAVDHFGNVITNLPAGWLTSSGVPVSSGSAMDVEVSGHTVSVQIITTYGERSAGTLVLLVGSHELLELAIVGGNAAVELGVSIGSIVRIRMCKPVLPAEHSG